MTFQEVNPVCETTRVHPSGRQPPLPLLQFSSRLQISGHCSELKPPSGGLLAHPLLLLGPPRCFAGRSPSRRGSGPSPRSEAPLSRPRLSLAVPRCLPRLCQWSIGSEFSARIEARLLYRPLLPERQRCPITQWLCHSPPECFSRLPAPLEYHPLSHVLLRQTLRLRLVHRCLQSCY